MNTLCGKIVKFDNKESVVNYQLEFIEIFEEIISLVKNFKRIEATKIYGRIEFFQYSRCKSCY